MINIYRKMVKVTTFFFHKIGGESVGGTANLFLREIPRFLHFVLIRTFCLCIKMFTKNLLK